MRHRDRFARGSSRAVALCRERAAGRRRAENARGSNRDVRAENRHPPQSACAVAGGACRACTARAQSRSRGRARSDAHERRQDARCTAREGRRQGAVHQGAGTRAARRARGHRGALDEGRPGRAAARASPAGHHGARGSARCARLDALRCSPGTSAGGHGGDFEPAPQVPARGAAPGPAHRGPARRRRHAAAAARRRPLRCNRARGLRTRPRRAWGAGDRGPGT